MGFLLIGLALSAQETPEGLIKRLGDDAPEVREAATAKLRALGEKARRELEEAAKNHADPEVRARAKEVLLGIEWGPFFPPYLDVFMIGVAAQLTSADPKVRLEALRQVQRKAPFTLDALMTRFLKDPDPDVVLYAAATLVGNAPRYTGGPDGVFHSSRTDRYPTSHRPAQRGLIEFLSNWERFAGRTVPYDRSKDVFPRGDGTVSADEVLARIPDLFPYLRRSDVDRIRPLAAHAEANIRKRAEGAIRRKTGEKFDAAAALASAEPEARLLGASAIRRTDPAKALPVLLALAADPDASLRYRAGAHLADSADPAASKVVVALKEEALAALDNLKDKARQGAIGLLCAVGDEASTQAMLKISAGGKMIKPAAMFVFSSEACRLVRPENVDAIFSSVVEDGNDEFRRVLTQGSGTRLAETAVRRAIEVLQADKREEWRRLALKVIEGQLSGDRRRFAGEESADLGELKGRLHGLVKGVLVDPEDPDFDALVRIARLVEARGAAPEIAAALAKRPSPEAIKLLQEWGVRESAPALRGILERYRGREQEAVYQREGEPQARPDVLPATVEALEFLGDKTDVPEAIRLHKAGHAESESLSLVAKHDPHAARPLMLEAMNGGRSGYRASQFARKLAVKEDLPILRKSFLDRTGDTGVLLSLLGEFMGREAVPVLRERLLVEKEYNYLREIAQALARLGDRTMAGEAMSRLVGEDPEKRIWGAAVAGGLGLREAIPTLSRIVRTVSDVDSNRGRFTLALGEAGGAEAIPEMLALFEEEGDNVDNYLFLRFFARHGVREALPAILDVEDDFWQVPCIDRILNFDFYRQYVKRFEAATVPFEPRAIADLVRSHYGVEVEISENLRTFPPKEGVQTARGYEDLWEFLCRVRSSGVRQVAFHAVVRDGRLWFCTPEEGEAHIEAWWKLHQGEFK